jgi:hypothetical protein
MAGLSNTKPFNVGPLVCQFVSHYFEDANAEYSVPHQLGVQPQGVFIAMKSSFCDIRDGEMPRTRGAVHLVSNTANVNVVVFLVGFTLF